MKRTQIPLLLAFVLFVAACSGSDGDEGQDTAPATTEQSSQEAVEATTTVVAESPTTVESVPEEPAIDPVVFDMDFSESIAPILTNSCAACHNEGGPGSPHMQLETAADAVAAAPFMITQINSGAMPPWPAGPQSIAFKNDLSLRQDEINAIAEWVNAGSPLDVDETMPLESDAGVLGLAEVDTTLAPDEPYQGSVAKTDDYRCRVYDPLLTESAFITGYNFVPDQTEVVHHAIGYLMPQEALGRAEAAAAQDSGAGWECFGGSGIGQDDLFLGWAPGQGPTEYPAGSGLKVEPGDFIVIQIHYHFEDSAPADNSTLELDFASDGEVTDEILVAEYIAPAEIPCSTEESGPLCDRDAAMARAIERFGREGVQADDFNAICRAKPEDFAAMTNGIASSSCLLPIYGFGEIVSVLGHEHEIGKSFRMTLNPGKPTEQVLLDIPDWSFDWQYNYYPEEQILLAPGDSVKIECSWDRSRRNPDLEPSYILWADGTNDEMCFSTIVTR